MDYRAALTEFYKQYNPDKLREIDLLLAKYKGREEELLHALKVKYGANKSPQSRQSPPPPASQPEASAQPTEPKEKPQPTEAHEPPPVQKTEKSSGEPDTGAEKTEGPLSSSVDKGRNAAERAEYWKKELEKRERERSLSDKARMEKKVPAKDTKTGSTEETADVEEEKVAGGFGFKKIMLILLLLVFLGGIMYVLLNSDIRNTIASKAGLTNSTDKARQEKKEGIEPGLMAQGSDPETSQNKNKSGDFALEEDEENDGNGSMSEESANPGKNNTTTNSGENSAAADNNPTGNGEVSGGLQRKFWYLSYMSVSSETSAQRLVRDLQNQGIENSGYYYIPDYDPRGKKLYKVYIGPYSSVEGAERALNDNMRKITSGAYPYFLK